MWGSVWFSEMVLHSQTAHGHRARMPKWCNRAVVLCSNAASLLDGRLPGTANPVAPLACSALPACFNSATRWEIRGASNSSQTCAISWCRGSSGAEAGRVQGESIIHASWPREKLSPGDRGVGTKRRARNDGHAGGTFLKRLINCLHTLSRFGWEGLDVSAEILVVDWATPKGNRPIGFETVPIP